MAKLVDEGENRILDILLGGTAVDGTLYLGLYTDVTEPAETDGLANLTEVSGTGYARKSLTRGSWDVTADLASYAQQTFEAGGEWGDVTGYFIGTSSDNTGKLLFVEHFTNGPYPIYNDGDQIKVTPKVRAA